MRILISGASGMIGTALRQHLQRHGHAVTALQRQQSSNGVWWDIASEQLHWGADPEFDAVIHLAGENIAGGRWSEARKNRIRSSRSQGTGLLARSLSAKAQKPEVLISCSAVGFYGDRGDDELTEHSSAGAGFLPDICREWEQACSPAVACGIRVVNIRLGMVLSPEGGALQKMLPPFRLGLGGPLGNGRQFISWIDIDDVCNAISHILHHREISGPVNLVAPQPVRNRDFSRALGKALKRPAMLPAPALALRLLLGDMADALLLSSTRVIPAKLLEGGFNFAQPDLYQALQKNT